MSQLDGTTETEWISTRHHYNRLTRQIELVIKKEELYQILKNMEHICGDVFSCPRCNLVHVSVMQNNFFLGFTLCHFCTDAIDSLSTMPFVIINARTGERHRLALHLLK